MTEKEICEGVSVSEGGHFSIQINDDFILYLDLDEIGRAFDLVSKAYEYKLTQDELYSNIESDMNNLCKTFDKKQIRMALNKYLEENDD